MGKRTEFSLRMVPMLLGVIEAKVTRGVALIEPFGLLDDNIVSECWSRRVDSVI